VNIAQLFLLTQRSLRNFIRQPALLRTRTAQTIFIALLVGLLFIKARRASLVAHAARPHSIDVARRSTVCRSAPTSAPSRLAQRGLGLRQRPLNVPLRAQDRNGLLFFCTVTNFMTSVLSVIVTFPAERAIFERERGSRMCVLPECADTPSPEWCAVQVHD
jgi:hypothetical protein